MPQTYSLEKKTLTLNQPGFGTVQLAGANNKDEITYMRTNESYTKESSADGGVAFAHNASKDGEGAVNISQTSPNIKDFIDLCNWQQANPGQAGATMSVKDELGQEDMTATGVFFNKLADVALGQTPAPRSFPFICESLDMQDGSEA